MCCECEWYRHSVETIAIVFRPVFSPASAWFEASEIAVAAAAVPWTKSRRFNISQFPQVGVN
jgi:hypothetical protein